MNFLIYGICLNACDSVTVEEIIIHGKEKTKVWVMLQEARVEKGQKILYLNLDNRVKEIQTDLIRTNLFASVRCHHEIIDEERCLVRIHCHVDESWLLMASPIFELADKNFTVWWDVYDQSLDRVNYGFKVFHYNLTGRKDRLKMKIHTGFTNKYELSYDYPYISRKNNLGLWIGGLHTTTRELNLKTHNNRQVFYRNEQQILQYRTSLFAQIKYRPDRYYTHVFTTEFHRYRIHKDIAESNPDFLLLGYDQLDYLQNTIFIKYSGIDLEVRPTTGLKMAGSLSYFSSISNGNVNMAQFTQELLYAQSMGKRLRWVVDMHLGQTIGSKRPPYLMSRALGYLYDTEGYEYYVIDGIHFIHASTGLFYRIFQYKRSFFKILGSEPRLKINLIGDIKINGNTAYVVNPWAAVSNTLSNTLLRSVTIGTDLLVNQSLKIQFNYSLNHLGQSGFFIQSKSAFR
ncbi:MAG: hypothetical protein IPM48_04825 [Saprospiraceae bacterium]|nr:hypothetical protein [Saprospiraceae bacterium]